MDAYLFDLDGTLLDSFEDIARSANYARQALGLAPRPEQEIYGFVGEGALRLLERTMGPENADLVEKALALWRDHYARHCLEHTKPFPGIPEALVRLPGARAVVTNKPGPAARKLVEALGLGALVSPVIGGGDVPSRKPDPEGCRLALSQMTGVERVVYIGDSTIDAQTALNGGYAFVGVLWGKAGRAELEALGATHFAQRVEDLPEVCARALDKG
ncbi:MAG: HAD-IA family hydrolase [Deltaproteobacteria bacterium]|nr:HAD-IA family hydrolase [Deltaproteobacteria bacterium]